MSALGTGPLFRLSRGGLRPYAPVRAVLRAPRRERLRLPTDTPAPLGYDAVGVAAGLGPRIARALPRMGCVFGDAQRWWWVVPVQSDRGLTWPAAVDYAVGGAVPVPRNAHAGPRLAHHPEDGVPYTHPIVLYIALCTTLGIRPDWGGPAER